MQTPLTLPTERESVTLRELTTTEDDQAYFDAVEANRDHLSQFDDPTSEKYQTLEDVKEARINAGDQRRMGIWDNDQFVGMIKIKPDDQRRAEVGYWLDSRFTGNGYASIATRAISRYARENFEDVFAEVVEGNEASANVLRRSGFTQTASETGRLTFRLLENIK